MELDEVQPHIAGLIAAVPELNAFGAPMQFSEFDDDETVENAIADRLRTTGVCIMVSDAEADRAADRSVRGVAADATFVVFVAESIAVAHTPSNQALRKAVISAVQARADQYSPRAEFQSSDTARDERGYVLRAITFTIRVVIQ